MNRELVAIGYGATYNYIYYMMGQDLYYDALLGSKLVQTKIRFDTSREWSRQEWRTLLVDLTHVEVILVDTWEDIDKQRVIRELRR